MPIMLSGSGECSRMAASDLRQHGNEEAGHRRHLIDLYHQRFGDHTPLIQRHDIGAVRTGDHQTNIQRGRLARTHLQSEIQRIRQNLTRSGFVRCEPGYSRQIWP
jgi:hypothetical protein